MAEGDKGGHIHVEIGEIRETLRDFMREYRAAATDRAKAESELINRVARVETTVKEMWQKVGSRDASAAHTELEVHRQRFMVLEERVSAMARELKREQDWAEAHRELHQSRQEPVASLRADLDAYKWGNDNVTKGHQRDIAKLESAVQGLESAWRRTAPAEGYNNLWTKVEELEKSVQEDQRAYKNHEHSGMGTNPVIAELFSRHEQRLVALERLLEGFPKLRDRVNGQSGWSQRLEDRMVVLENQHHDVQRFHSGEKPHYEFPAGEPRTKVQEVAVEGLAARVETFEESVNSVRQKADYNTKRQDRLEGTLEKLQAEMAEYASAAKKFLDYGGTLEQALQSVKLADLAERLHQVENKQDADHQRFDAVTDALAEHRRHHGQALLEKMDAWKASLEHQIENVGHEVVRAKQELFEFKHEITRRGLPPSGAQEREIYVVFRPGKVTTPPIFIDITDDGGRSLMHDRPIRDKNHPHPRSSPGDDTRRIGPFRINWW